MRDGKYKSGEASLRLKQDIEDQNPQMWDLVAYRVFNAQEKETEMSTTAWEISGKYIRHMILPTVSVIASKVSRTHFVQQSFSYRDLHTNGC